MRTAWLALAVAALMAAWAGPASAMTLYDNGGPNHESAFYSDPTNFFYLSYDTFALSSDSTITGMEWWGQYYPGNTPPTPDAFAYIIRSNLGSFGSPDLYITSGSLDGGNRTDTLTTDNITGCEIYQYNATGLDITLSAGSYFLSIYDTASNPNNSFGWCDSNNADAAGDVWLWDVYDATFSGGGPNSVDLAFNLTGDETTGAVPEPATVTLLGLGLAGLVAKFARRRNR